MTDERFTLVGPRQTEEPPTRAAGRVGCGAGRRPRCWR